MTKDDVLFGYRLQLFSLAADRGASQACRLMGVHRSMPLVTTAAGSHQR